MPVHWVVLETDVIVVVPVRITFRRVILRTKRNKSDLASRSLKPEAWQ